MKRAINKYDIYNENFENYFRDLMATISLEQRERLPDDLLHKIFKKGVLNTGDLSFKEKTYILSIAFNKHTTIVIEDERNGLTEKDFKASTRAQAGRITNTEVLENPSVRSSFILSDKELFNSIMYINHLQCTDIYRLIRRINPKERNKRDKSFAETREALRGLTTLLLSYEKNKKRLVMEHGLDVPQIYALLFFAGGERLGTDFYNREFKYAYSANARLLAKTLTGMHAKGLLKRRGGRKLVKYDLSARGIAILDKVLNKTIELYV